MNFENFVTEFLLDLKNNNNHAITLLDENKELINENLGKDANPKTLDSFIRDLSDIVIRNDKKKFKVIEKALKHDTMTTVFDRFKQSDVMIKAVRVENKSALKWLQSINVSPYATDVNGMTVLMHLVQNFKMESFIKPFASDAKCVEQVDKNGRTTLFHALDNTLGLWKLMESNVDINHRDNDGNTALLYCLKNNIKTPLSYLIKNNIDVNAVDNDGRTAAMYLALKGIYADTNVTGTSAALYESVKGKYSLINKLKEAKCNFNFVNEYGESVLSLLLKQMYRPKGVDSKLYGKYICTLISLLYTDCDFNAPVDRDGNTPMMVFLMVNDMDTYEFVKSNNENLDLTKKNNYGENAVTLYLKYKEGNVSEYANTTDYGITTITEDMLEKEKSLYKTMKKQLGAYGKTYRIFEYIGETFETVS